NGRLYAWFEVPFGHPAYPDECLWNMGLSRAEDILYCLDAADGNPATETEENAILWAQRVNHTQKGISLATIVNGNIYVPIYKRDNTIYKDSSYVVGYDGATGQPIDTLKFGEDDGYAEGMGIKCGRLAYDTATERLFIQSDGRAIYSVKITAEGRFDRESIKMAKVTQFGAGGPEPNIAPTAYNGRLYVNYNRFMGIFNAETLELIYLVDMGETSNQGPRCINSTPLVCTAFATPENGYKVYIYASREAYDWNNDGPDRLICLVDSAGSTAAEIVVLSKGEIYSLCPKSLVADRDGRLYDVYNKIVYRSLFPVESLKLKGDVAINMEIGESQTLSYTVTPYYATDKTVTWTSSNTAVATVSESGLITAVAAGEADITVTTTDGGFTAVCKVTVKAASVPDDPTVAVTGVTLDKTAAELRDGGYAMPMTATVDRVAAKQ
ncbi:MAG: Ig-like domain-containing protein, partial [Bacteroidales bacterium]|nr:Ig-like domain-containing protein [Bacteroidales bacterium]